MAKIDPHKWEMDHALWLAERGDTVLLCWLLQERLGSQEPEAVAYLNALLDRSRKLPPAPRRGYFDLRKHGRKEGAVMCDVEKEISISYPGRQRLPRGERERLIVKYARRRGTPAGAVREWLKRGGRVEDEKSIYQKINLIGPK